MSVVNCPDCGKIISVRFPFHQCNSPDGQQLTPEAIKKLRQELKLTQPELAEKLKVAPITISRWERGTQRMAPEVAKRLQRLMKKEDNEDGGRS